MNLTEKLRVFGAHFLPRKSDATFHTFSIYDLFRHLYQGDDNFR